MQCLEERKIGFDVRVTRVPIVCGAVLFDLTAGPIPWSDGDAIFYPRDRLRRGGSERRRPAYRQGDGASGGRRGEKRRFSMRPEVLRGYPIPGEVEAAPSSPSLRRYGKTVGR